MPSQPCGLHRRHSRIESVVPYTNAPAKKGQVYFGRFYLGKRKGPTAEMRDRPFLVAWLQKL